MLCLMRRDKNQQGQEWVEQCNKDIENFMELAMTEKKAAAKPTIGGGPVIEKRKIFTFFWQDGGVLNTEDVKVTNEM